MVKQNWNLAFAFFVPRQFAELEGAEKALRVKVTAALLREGCVLSFLL